MPTSVLLQIMESVVVFLPANHIKLPDVHCIESIHVIMFILAYIHAFGLKYMWTSYSHIFYLPYGIFIFYSLNVDME